MRAFRLETKFSLAPTLGNEEKKRGHQIVNLLPCFFYMFLTLILIALFPLSAAEQNENNPKDEEKLFER
jgi:hypothetical protein